MAKTLREQITEFLRRRVTVVELLRRMSPLPGKNLQLPVGQDTNFFVTCPNPNHDDKDASFHVGDNPYVATCFGEKLSKLSIFDIYGLSLGYNTPEVLRSNLGDNVRSVAALFRSEIEVHFGPGIWERTFERGRAESLRDRYFKTLSGLEPFESPYMPPRTVNTALPLMAWTIPEGDKEPYNTLLLTAGKEYRALKARQEPIVVVWYEMLNVFGFHTQALGLLGIGQLLRRQSESARTFGFRSVRNWVVTGREIMGKARPSRAFDCVRFYFVVENPIDYHVLSLLEYPVTLATWPASEDEGSQFRAGIEELKRQSVEPFLALRALAMKGTDTLRRFTDYCERKPLPDWLPSYREIPFPSLARLEKRTVESLINQATSKPSLPALTEAP